MNRSPLWPAGFEPVERLSQGLQGSVWKALAGGQPCVLRVYRNTQASLELDALAGLKDPLLAGLVDFGSLSDGSFWLARQWIEGQPLPAALRQQPESRVREWYAGLCEALERLHAAGLVHADLKCANAILSASGRIILTDFGLAQRLRSRAEHTGVSGSLSTLSPEALDNLELDGRADLFAVGAMLYDGLCAQPRALDEFYARFPAEDFFASAQSDAEQLPEWSRALIGELVQRDREQRPSRAGVVRLRLMGPQSGERTGPNARAGVPAIWQSTPREGREARMDQLEQHLERECEADGLIWIATEAGEDCAALSAELARAAQARGQRLERAEAESWLRPGEHALRSDAELEARLHKGGGALLLQLPQAGPLELRALARLARIHATLQSRRALVWVGPDWPAEGAPPPRTLRWSLRSRAEWETLLAARLEPSSRQHAGTLAERAHAVQLAPEVLARQAQEQDVLAATDRGWRVLGDPARLVLEPPAPTPADAGQRAEKLMILLRLDPLRREYGLERYPQDERCAVHQRLATQAESLLERQFHAYLSQDSAGSEGAQLEELAQAVAECTERGQSERSLWVLQRVRECRAGRELPALLQAEEAQAWIQLGELERAREALEGGLPAQDARARARLVLVRGQWLARQRQFAAALECISQVAQLDAQARNAALLAEAQIWLESGEEGRLEALRLEEPADWRTGYNLDMLRAIARLRRGEFAAARELLETRRAQAESRGDLLAAAAAQLNLAQLERREGRAAEALAHYAAAAACHQQIGSLSGLAQAHGQRGILLRELGQLREASAALEEALRLRERLGDPLAVLRTRATLGLVRAERGHLAAARECLEESALGLSSSPQEAALLSARALELKSRVHARVEWPPTLEQSGDPRVLLALARAAANLGQLARARAQAQQAVSAAERLRNSGLAREAQSLIAQLCGEGDTGLASRLAQWSENPQREEEWRRLAQQCALSGRDDVAARIYLALCARSPQEALVADDWQQAQRHLEAVLGGLSQEERTRALHFLLGRADPLPGEWARARRRAEMGELDMELLKVLELNHRLVLQEALPELLGSVVECALEVSGAERGFLVLATRGELRIDTARDSRRGALEEPELELSRSIVRRALESGRPLRISNAAQHVDLANAPSVTALDLRAVLCVPFRIEAELDGVIYVDHRARSDAFGERAERLVALLADQAALAIRQVRRREEIQELNRELARDNARKESDLRTAQAVLAARELAVPPSGLIGSSTVMRRVHGLIERAARARLPVLVRGESGTGKELAARALHQLSPWSDKPFVGENCAAFPEALIETELFGSKKGSYTGALEDRMGLFERAGGGTLFLDEIGELPLELQAKLLRVLETGEVRRIGDSQVRKVEFRLVAATNRDLEAWVAEGRFRADLYYRLDGLRIDMPMLRERLGDIPELVEHFLRMESARSGRPCRMDPAVLAALVAREWPGNVRELSNEVARLLVLSGGDTIRDPGLVRPAAAAGVTGMQRTRTFAPDQIRTLADLEREAIEGAVSACAGDKSLAAERLGISRAKIYQRWKEWHGDRG